MDEFSYLTVSAPAEGLYKEKGSKFLSFVFPVADEVDVKRCLERLRKEYFDARHHCYAWVLGASRSLYRVSDDGEPNHSAGDPILGQIKSRNLTNVLVVVVRYFGGVKLGVGGLVAAYRTAAKDALDKSQIIQKELTKELKLRYDYENTAEVMRLVKEFDMDVLSQQYHETCELIVSIKVRFEEKMKQKVELLNATGTRVTIPA